MMIWIVTILLTHKDNPGFQLEWNAAFKSASKCLEGRDKQKNKFTENGDKIIFADCIGVKLQ